MRRGTRITTAVVTAITAVAMGTGAAFGVLGLPDFGGSEASERTPAPPPTVSPSPTPPTPEVVPEPEPEALLEAGDRGVEVRDRKSVV